jgi:hypothetical protein
MNAMNFPGFTAEASLIERGGRYSTVMNGASHPELNNHGVVLALDPTGGDRAVDCTTNCMEACLGAGRNRTACSTECRKKCRPSLPAYQCTPRDNSVDNFLCLGGVWAWEQACRAECALVGSIPGLGSALATACNAGCTALSNNMRTDCPPAEICV